MLFAFLNVVFVGVVSVIAQAMQFSDSLSLYAIGQILVGQELPEESAVSAPEQVFAFAVGILGLSSFAVVLALVEQAVLEILEANVRQGSNVIEEAHVVLLSWWVLMSRFSSSLSDSLTHSLTRSLAHSLTRSTGGRRLAISLKRLGS